MVLGRVTAGSAQWLLWRVTTRGGAEKPRQTEGSAETCPRWVVGPSPELGRGPRGLSRAQLSRSVCVSPARALALGHPVRLLSHLSLSCAVGCLVATPEERGRGPSRGRRGWADDYAGSGAQAHLTQRDALSLCLWLSAPHLFPGMSYFASEDRSLRRRRTEI